MKWNKYQQNFITAAQAENFSNEKIVSLLNYAKNLYDKKLPIIYDNAHFSKLVGYKIEYIERAIKYTTHFYKHYYITKKNGGKRQISEPLPSLKEIQYWILKNILERLKINLFAKAYVKKRSLKYNAIFHKNKRVVLTIDIENFFGSIKKEKIYFWFTSLGYNDEVSETLSSICTLNGVLPQGSPTSPYLSNLIFQKNDEYIANFCKPRKINYTRYSDDLTFSGSFHIGGIINYVNAVLENDGFLINKDKLRTRARNQRQEVTGIVVNHKLNTPIETRKKFRQSVYYIRKYGFESHVNHLKISKSNYIQHLIGIGNFICYVDPKNVSAKSDLEYLKSLYNEMADR